MTRPTKQKKIKSKSRSTLVKNIVLSIVSVGLLVTAYVILYQKWNIHLAEEDDSQFISEFGGAVSKARKRRQGKAEMPTVPEERPDIKTLLTQTSPGSFVLDPEAYVERAHLKRQSERRSQRFLKRLGKQPTKPVAKPDPHLTQWRSYSDQELAVLTPRLTNSVEPGRLPNSEGCRFEGHEDWVVTLAFSSDGSLLATGSRDGTVRLWSVTSEKLILEIDAHTLGVESLQFSSDQSRILSSGLDGSAAIWNVADGRELRRFQGRSKALHCAAFSHDGTRIATCGYDNLEDPVRPYNSVQVWDAFSGEESLVLSDLIGVEDVHRRIHNQFFHTEFSPDDRFLYAIGYAVFIWDLESPQSPPNTLRSNAGKIEQFNDGISKSPGITFEVILTERGPEICIPDNQTSLIRFWSLKSGSEEAFQEVLPFTVAEISPSGRYLALGNVGEIVIWDTHELKVVRTIETYGGMVTALAFDPNEGRLACGMAGDGNRISIFH